MNVRWLASLLFLACLGCGRIGYLPDGGSFIDADVSRDSAVPHIDAHIDASSDAGEDASTDAPYTPDAIDAPVLEDPCPQWMTEVLPRCPGPSDDPELYQRLYQQWCVDLHHEPTERCYYEWATYGHCNVGQLLMHCDVSESWIECRLLIEAYQTCDRGSVGDL
jgi:hypothetical protein